MNANPNERNDNMNTTELRTGTRVSYEDMANPLREGTVAEILESLWGTQYRVAFDDGTETTSDCRQRGWKVMPAPAGRYEVKCDECRQTIRRTDSVAESAAGGRCDKCKPAASSSSSVAKFERHVTALAGVYRRMDRGELTGRNSDATERTIDGHYRDAAALLKAELDDEASPIYAELERRPRLAAKWYALERRYFGLRP